MLGLKKCPELIKKAYKKAVDYTCEDCGKKEPEIKLEIHRIIRGNMGGTYRPGNVKVLCEKCHKEFHNGEW